MNAPKGSTLEHKIRCLEDHLCSACTLYFLPTFGKYYKLLFQLSLKNTKFFMSP